MNEHTKGDDVTGMCQFTQELPVVYLYVSIIARKRAKLRGYHCQASLARRDKLRTAERNGTPLYRAGEL